MAIPGKPREKLLGPLVPEVPVYDGETYDVELTVLAVRIFAL